MLSNRCYEMMIPSRYSVSSWAILLTPWALLISSSLLSLHIIYTRFKTWRFDLRRVPLFFLLKFVIPRFTPVAFRLSQSCDCTLVKELLMLTNSVLFLNFVLRGQITARLRSRVCLRRFQTRWSCFLFVASLNNLHAMSTWVVNLVCLGCIHSFGLLAHLIDLNMFERTLLWSVISCWDSWALYHFLALRIGHRTRLGPGLNVTVLNILMLRGLMLRDGVPGLDLASCNFFVVVNFLDALVVNFLSHVANLILCLHVIVKSGSICEFDCQAEWLQEHIK